MTDTPLSRYADACNLGKSLSMLSDASPALVENLAYPMYTLPMDTLLRMTAVRPHEELLNQGSLVEFEEVLGRAMFISHQWLANEHPDPEAQQWKVLQEAIRNLYSGRSLVTLPIQSEYFYGRHSTLSREDFQSKPLFIWYDYVSCPQAADSRGQEHQKQAIDSIVSYIERCVYFVVLCPNLPHKDQGFVLSEATWAERGWCRAERLARKLAAREDGCILVVESAMRQTLALHTARPIDAPGLGKFSVESDRSRIGRVILQMVWKKLLYFLEQGDLHNYRFLLNQQAAFFFANTDIDPIDALVPYFQSQADPFTAPLDVAVEWFLHQNGFQEPVSRDPAGWTPLCYAVMAGSPSLISALLERKADCNDRISKHKKDFMFPKGMSVLALAAYFHNTGALQVLLAARASLHACDSHRQTPLHWACISDNDTAVRELGEARADLGQHSFPGVDPLHLACAFGSVGAMTEIFGRHQRVCLQNSLHFALSNEGGSALVISTLIQARADVNDKFHTINGLWRFIIFRQGLRHKFSPSLLTTLSPPYLHFNRGWRLRIRIGGLRLKAYRVYVGLATFSFPKGSGEYCRCPRLFVYV
ncbi:caiap [Symbiodinium sp. CCMP2456]|nr:caiap [Symbiodinium sp. CCMP2456]